MDVPWSISTEWFAYLLFPLLVFGFLKLRGVPQALLIALACVALLLFYDYVVPQQAQPRYYLLRCVPSFMLGMLIFQVPRWMPRRAISWFERDQAFILTLVAAFLCLLLRVPDIMAIISFFFVALAGSLNHGRTAHALSIKPLYFLGMISYSIYLVHTLVLRVWQMAFEVLWHGHLGLAQATVAFVVVMSAVLIAGTLSYYYVETPGPRYFGRFARRPAISPEAPLTVDGSAA